MIGVLGGSGLLGIEEWGSSREEVIKTPYGEPSHAIKVSELDGSEVAFIARHGNPHHIPPHLINYRANLWALESLGVKTIISVATVGSIAPEIQPGDLVFPNQIIDYTSAREHTFFDGHNNPLNHIDFTYPYEDFLRSQFIASSQNLQIKFIENGCYASVNGPRLETAAEINRYENDGATIVGMTGMPETALARELGISYAAICPVANHAAGRGLSKEGLNLETINKNSKEMMASVVILITEVIKKIDH
jgi:5'-deoxy-5'-methylthioadenosine phosphorylase